MSSRDENPAIQTPTPEPSAQSTTAPSPQPGDGDPAIRPRRPLSSIIMAPRIMLGVLLMYAGMGVFYFLRTDVPFSLQVERYGSTALALGLGAIGFYLFSTEFFKWRSLQESRFVDVDARSRSNKTSADYEQVLWRLKDLQSSVQATDSRERLKDDPTGATEPSVPRIEPATEFMAYFESIRKLLEQKASIADEKASILLDKGTAYSRFGIIFFILCIVSWQAMSYWTGFQIQYLYGIISTSLLFIFVEFLSAWFLKQYRQFIDTSTYLIKVKSIFDRYMLVYLASKEAISNGHDSKKSNQLLLDLLKSDISWPDTYLTKNPDVSFAREALETMTLLMKSMKSEAQEVARKESKSPAAKKAA